MKKKCLAIITVALFFTCKSFSQTKSTQNENPQEKGRPNIEELFAKMDSNQDSKLSKEEVKGPLKNDFSKIDLNNDGFLTKEEIKKATKPDRKEPPQGNRPNQGQVRN
jgi:Ca2+-binding EF-hand superfamily protein